MRFLGSATVVADTGRKEVKRAQQRANGQTPRSLSCAGQTRRPAVKQIPSSAAIVEQGRSTGREDRRVGAYEQHLEALCRSTDKGVGTVPFPPCGVCLGTEGF